VQQALISHILQPRETQSWQESASDLQAMLEEWQRK